MTKKQKKMLIRIIIAAVLMAVLHFLPVSGVPLFLLYLIPYGIIGYDILRKAWKGILNRQVFDENFLMAVATLGALAIGLLKTGDPQKSVENEGTQKVQVLRKGVRGEKRNAEVLL